MVVRSALAAEPERVGREVVYLHRVARASSPALLIDDGDLVRASASAISSSANRTAGG
jgi:hypothetical protein